MSSKNRHHYLVTEYWNLLIDKYILAARISSTAIPEFKKVRDLVFDRDIVNDYIAVLFGCFYVSAQGIWKCLI